MSNNADSTVPGSRHLPVGRKTVKVADDVPALAPLPLIGCPFHPQMHAIGYARPAMIGTSNYPIVKTKCILHDYAYMIRTLVTETQLYNKKQLAGRSVLLQFRRNAQPLVYCTWTKTQDQRSWWMNNKYMYEWRYKRTMLFWEINEIRVVNHKITIRITT